MVDGSAGDRISVSVVVGVALDPVCNSADWCADLEDCVCD